MFKNVKFVVDRFHYNESHKCSALFKMDTYPLLRDIDSSLGESNNARVQRIKPQLSQMTQKNYMEYLRITTSYRNKFKIDSIEKNLKMMFNDN